jgi:flagellar basal body-associated protein FliL
MIPKRRIIILGSIVVVVILASAAFALYISQQQNKSSTNSNDSSQSGSTPSLSEKSPAEKEADAAEKTAYKGDVQGGVKQLDNAIANTSDKNDLYVFYSRKATLLLNNNMLADALEAAKDKTYYQGAVTELGGTL